jgi:hypothetical protein
LRNTRLWLLFLLILTVYLLPWVVSPGVSLSPSGYDLAEWASIHPAAMSENPPLLTPLLLRLPLVSAALSLAYGLRLDNRNRVLGAAAVVLMSLALLPPFEIVDDRENWNYRQQLLLAVAVLAGSPFGLTGWLGRFRRGISAVAAIMGLAASLFGLSRAFQWMQDFGLPASIGAGGLLTAVLFVGLILAQTRIGQRASLRHPIPVGQQH